MSNWPTPQFGWTKWCGWCPRIGSLIHHPFGHRTLWPIHQPITQKLLLFTLNLQKKQYLENDLLHAKLQLLFGIHDRVRGVQKHLFNIGKSFNLSLEFNFYIEKKKKAPSNSTLQVIYCINKSTHKMLSLALLWYSPQKHKKKSIWKKEFPIQLNGLRSVPCIHRWPAQINFQPYARTRWQYPWVPWKLLKYWIRSIEGHGPNCDFLRPMNHFLQNHQSANTQPWRNCSAKRKVGLFGSGNET